MSTRKARSEKEYCQLTDILEMSLTFANARRYQNMPTCRDPDNPLALLGCARLPPSKWAQHNIPAVTRLDVADRARSETGRHAVAQHEGRWCRAISIPRHPRRAAGGSPKQRLPRGCWRGRGSGGQNHGFLLQGDSPSRSFPSCMVRYFVSLLILLWLPLRSRDVVLIPNHPLAAIHPSLGRWQHSWVPPL